MRNLKGFEGMNGVSSQSNFYKLILDSIAKLFPCDKIERQEVKSGWN